MLRIDLTGQCSGGGNVLGSYVCPENSINLGDGSCDSRCDYGEVFDSQLSACIPPPENCNNPKEGNPVEVATGRKLQSFVDHFSRMVDIKRDLYQDESGSVWGHTLTEIAQLGETNGVAYLKISNGAKAQYLVKRDEECWRFSGGLCRRVEFDDDGMKVWLGSQLKTYDSLGRLVSQFMLESPKNVIRYIYEENKIIRELDSGTIEAGIDDEGRITHLSTDEGEIRYEYYDISGLLKSVSYPDQSAEMYIYTDGPPYLLTEIQRNGKPFAFWRYDSWGRVTKSFHAGGFDTFVFDYFADDVLVTNPLGKQTRYVFETVDNVRLVKKVQGEPSPNCAAANKSYDYYDNGTLKSKTDWEGNVTTYLRDDWGREVARTEAAGTPEARTITTEYHSEFNKPVRITEPGLVTDMTYDTAGRLLSTQKTSATVQ